MLGLLVPGRRILALGLLPALVANVYVLAPFFLPLTPSVAAADSSLRVATLNIFTENEDYDAVINYLVDRRPDVVMLTEAEPALMIAVEQSVADLYPYVLDDSMRGTLGLALLSRQPFVTAAVVPLTDDGRRRRRLLRAEIEWHGERVILYGAHPLPPLSGRLADRRDTEIATIQAMIAEDRDPLILLGDFNASPWAVPMRQLLAEPNLQHAAQGFGIYPTWYYRRAFFGAPLDHILISPHWDVIAYQTNGDIGSDHHPVLADLAVKTLLSSP
jgi:endonuclease/exonuclease/phosphatase (EEP) superfamily protein YafD